MKKLMDRILTKFYVFKNRLWIIKVFSWTCLHMGIAGDKDGYKNMLDDMKKTKTYGELMNVTRHYAARYGKYFD